MSRSKNRYKVHRHFLYWTEHQFLQLVTQKERGLPSYRREVFREIVSYDFLLPLANERNLRETLDNLFYKETLERILQTITPPDLEQHFPKLPGEPLDAYFSRLAKAVAKLFGGYSIMHAAGRFRAGDLMTKLEAANSNYIVDETTAFVRFIIPCSTSRRASHDSTTKDLAQIAAATGKEVEQIRFLFLNIFAETVVMNVLDEQEIWLIERALGREQLFCWISKG